MSEQLLAEIYHWVPMPIVTGLGLYFFRQWLMGHEEKLNGLVTRLEAASAVITQHHAALDRLKERVDELWLARVDLTNLKVEVARLKSYIAGSGPKLNPLLRQSENEE